MQRLLSYTRQAVTADRFKRTLRQSASLDFVSLEEIERLQLESLNSVWRRAIEEVPAIRQQAAAIQRLDGFASLEDFASTVPILEKADLRGESPRSAARYDVLRITGGSTAEPTRLPAWKAEFEHAREVMTIGRAWNDIRPWDHGALIWGHSHLLGSGASGWFKGRIRGAKDLLQGYERHSAYDISDGRLPALIEALTRSKPDYVIGYARALDAIARRIVEMDVPAGRFGRIKCVVSTAEMLPFADSAEIIQQAFGAPLAMEYGTVETGPIAYTRPGRGYQVFWWKYLVERAPHPAGHSELLVTALYPRATPLFRYRVGDRLLNISRTGQDGRSVLEFAQLGGRSNQPVRLPSGRELHSEVASHIFRLSKLVRHYQLWCAKDGVEARYVAPQDIDGEDVQELLRVASQIDPELADCLRFKRVQLDGLRQAASGKFPFVVYAPSWSSCPPEPSP
jgi:phenylacetate-coenzyme A ligase PaaK-like adenylate-forming protein